MMQLECQHCGSDFEGIRTTGKYCTTKCRRAAEYIRRRPQYLWYAKEVYRERNLERLRKDRKDNPEKYAKRGRKRYARLKKDPEKYAEKLEGQREWLSQDRLKNPDKHKIYQLRNARSRVAKKETAETLYKLEIQDGIK